MIDWVSFHLFLRGIFSRSQSIVYHSLRGHADGVPCHRYDSLSEEELSYWEALVNIYLNLHFLDTTMTYFLPCEYIVIKFIITFTIDLQEQLPNNEDLERELISWRINPLPGACIASRLHTYIMSNQEKILY